MEVVTRRFELLKLEGLGLSQAEIAKQLSQNAECSMRTIYHDFETRALWQPSLQSLSKTDDVLLKAINRYEQIYRQASMIVHSSSNESAKIGALNIMLKSNSKLCETAALTDILSRLKDLEDEVRKGALVK